jgi:cellulose biosynthesis protein BcsQ
MGEIVSFYSYKGGVGRTMALANVAVLLAQRGHRVLVVDFDVDAPGLHRYFPHDGTELKNGVIEMFIEMMRELDPGEPSRNASPTVPGIVRRALDDDSYGYDVRVRDPSQHVQASLRVLTAGRFDDGYARRMHGFPWASLYEERGDLFDELAAGWRQRYDYVLIDSRTGLSDIGSVSTVILADKLVLAFTPNEQSLNGAVEVGRQAVLLKRAIPGAGSLSLFPLLSRVDEGEEQQRRQFSLDAAQRFGRLFDDMYRVDDVDFAYYFDAVRIPHSGHYAYGERISAEEDLPSVPRSLAAGYARFFDYLRGDRLVVRRDRPVAPVGTTLPSAALVASFETEFDPPGSLRFDKIIRAPERLPAEMATRLRAVPIDGEAWKQALDEIDRGVARATAAGGGDLHVFATMPYPAAVYLGRRLDDLSRARPLRIYQIDPDSRSWVPFSSPDASGTLFFRDLEAVPCSSKGDALILAIEGMRSIGDEALQAAADRVHAGSIHRLRPRSAVPLRSQGEVQAAVASMRSALLRIQSDGPRPIHVISTAPVALLIELGRLAVPTVYRSVVVHQFDPQARQYVPVLDVIARRVMSRRTLPSVAELQRRATARVAALRPVADAGAVLFAVEVSGIQRFVFDIPTDNAGVEVKARSFLVALLPKVLAWRARHAESLHREHETLGAEHEVFVAAGRAVLLVPSAKARVVRAALIADARLLRDQTGDELSVDVIEQEVERGLASLAEAIDALPRRFEEARLRRARSEPEDFWAPLAPPPDRPPEEETPFAKLGKQLRSAAGRIGAVGVAAGDAARGKDGWSEVLGLGIAVGSWVGNLPPLDGSPRLLLQTDDSALLPGGSDGDEVASLPLAGTWILTDGERPLDFDGLARRAKGDAKLGVLRLDLDSLGEAFCKVVKGKRGDAALRDRLVLSEAVSLVCGALADEVTWPGEKPRDVQWILAGGDDLFLVGAWSEIVDTSLALRQAIVPPLREVVRALAGEGEDRALDLSGGIVVADARVPLAHLADEAEEQVLCAKGDRTTRTEAKVAKGAVSWGGVAMGWDDWKLVIELGQELGDAIAQGKVRHGIIRRLVGIHTLWHRARRELDGGKPREAAESNKRQWLWAYDLGRAPRGLEAEGAALVERLARLALEDLDTATGKRTERPAAAWLGIVAEIAHRRTRGRGEERG